MSDKYTEAFDSLTSDEDTKRKRTERILSAQSANADEITVQTGTASAAKVRRHIFSGKRGVALIMAAVMLISVLFLGLFFWLNNKSHYNNIYDLMKNVQMINEDFIGFSLSSVKNKNAKQKNKAAISNVAYAETGSDNTDTNGLVAITEDFETEEVCFKKANSAEEITNEDINQFGAITQFFVMNNLLFIEITEHEALNTNEVEENSYFTLGNGCAVFVVDLDSKKVYSMVDVFTDQDLWNGRVLYFNLEHGLLSTNPDIANTPSATYFIDLQDNNLELIKVADTPCGEYLQDKYKNIYLIDDTYHHPELNLYKFEYIDLLICDNSNYEYFLSTDKQIYRAFKSNFEYGYNHQYYTDIESLQADKTWHKDYSSSNKILMNQLPYSTYFQGGSWMLKDGRIVRIADYFNHTAYCYNVDGKIIAHIKNKEEEAILYLCDESQITADFEYIDLYFNGYADYDRVISYTTDSYICRYNIQVGRTGLILTEYSVVLYDDTPPKRYKIVVNDGSIELVPIEPIYNGFEIVSEIIFLS